MKYTKGTLGLLVAILIMGTGMNAFGFLGFGNSASWKEEVLLHDGTTLVVNHSQNYGGYPTVESRDRKVTDEEWAFTVPGTNRKVTWKNDFGNTPESSSVMVFILDFLNGVPYLATSPAGCIAYNRWGRPNPPYVFFKYDGSAWQRIPLEEFPREFTTANVYVGRLQPRDRGIDIVTTEMINKSNRELSIHQPHLRQIVREPITKGDGPWRYPEMEYDGKGGWRSPGGAKAPHPITSPPDLTDGQK